MKTIVIQIGNSDNKLSQLEWSQFVVDVRLLVSEYCEQIHFDGGSSYDSSWQNACFVAEVSEKFEAVLLSELTYCRKNHNQDSIAVTIGNTIFI